MMKKFGTAEGGLTIDSQFQLKIEARRHRHSQFSIILQKNGLKWIQVNMNRSMKP